ncbi:hypothetical protein FISHEDRAFT_65277 [Fistulina hepatica ATCC 64428]|nr:hypothetical protein FISHEDRAFT_65277 [Fistulina hepatica ATCC 64428]
MTVRYSNYRLAFYCTVFVLSGVVLGLGGHLASLFLPKLHQGITIFTLIVPSLTIFLFFLTFNWAQPWLEASVYALLWAVWLSQASWATDVIGYVQCDALAGQKTATKNGDMNAQQYCYEFKVIQAFSWMQFVLFTFAIMGIFYLVQQAQRYGRPYIWTEPVRDLGWFHELPGYPFAGMIPLYSAPQVAQGGYYNQYPNQYPQMSSGGHTLVIQPGVNGQPAMVTSVPMNGSMPTTI